MSLSEKIKTAFSFILVFSPNKSVLNDEITELRVMVGKHHSFLSILIKFEESNLSKRNRSPFLKNMMALIGFF